MGEFTYKTIAGNAEGLYKEKGSKFIALAYPVHNEEDVKRHIAEVKRAYHDARHHCYAYALGPEREQYLPMLAEQEKELSWVRKSRFFTPRYKVKRLVLKYFPHLAGIYFRRKALALITDE